MITKKGLKLPDDLSQRLESDLNALIAFECMRPSCQKEYTQWIEGAKTDEARKDRIEKTIVRAKEWKHRRDISKSEEYIEDLYYFDN